MNYTDPKMRWAFNETGSSGVGDSTVHQWFVMWWTDIEEEKNALMSSGIVCA